MADERAALDRLLAAADARLAALALPFARRLARAVRRAAGRGGTLDPARRPLLAATADALTAAFFGATPAEALTADGIAVSPFARALTLSVREATAAALVGPIAAADRALAGRSDLRAALRSPAPRRARTPIFEPARTWVDPNGYRLSDRIWQSGREVRARIDALLDYHIARGTRATAVAGELERFLTVVGRRSQTRTPYGRKGLYAPRRLARTEVTRAHGAATVEAVALNPFMAATGWRLSARHPEPDECDQNASRDDYGLGRGNYPPRSVPRWPNHPQDLCVLVPVARPDAERVIADLERWARGEDVPRWEDVGGAPLEVGALTDWLTGLAEP